LVRIIFKLFKWLLALVLVAIIAAAAWLYFFPPALIRVGAGYTAKIVCSNVFIAKRRAETVLDVDVQAPGNPILKLFSVDVDQRGKIVRAALLGLFGEQLAIARPGYGCTLVPDGELSMVAATPDPVATPEPRAGVWPRGERVAPSQDPDFANILDDTALTGPGMRAVVAVLNGRIVGERYGEGFNARTPLLGWSMTKTVNAAIVGTLVKSGKLSLDRKGVFDAWAGDGRAEISLADMMAMTSGLEFNEDYGDVTDVTGMLYLEPDMAGFAAAKPLAHDPGTSWSYSSGTAVMLSRIWQDALGDADAALAYPREALFEPLGMASAVLEPDARGTFVGSSYLYATAHDWARFGQFLLQDGAWNGNQILPEDFVDWMSEPVAASKDVYAKGQIWIEGPGDEEAPGAGVPAGVPADTVWLEGHDGQTVAVVPSKQLVVVRLGLTPSKLGYRPQKLVAALARAIKMPE
jgi:CubicO group peptidase (beta-lactamase class C family)